MNLQNINNGLLYKDQLSVFRYVITEDEDGSNKRELAVVPELTDIPCRLDIKRADDAELPEDVNSIKATYTVFADPNHALKAGDHITVQHQGKTYALITGDPVLYLYHQEIPAIQEKLA